MDGREPSTSTTTSEIHPSPPLPPPVPPPRSPSPPQLLPGVQVLVSDQPQLYDADDSVSITSLESDSEHSEVLTELLQSDPVATTSTTANETESAVLVVQSDFSVRGTVLTEPTPLPVTEPVQVTSIHPWPMRITPPATIIRCRNDDCEEQTASFLCTGCRQVRYCSRYCQRLGMTGPGGTWDRIFGHALPPSHIQSTASDRVDSQMEAICRYKHLTAGVVGLMIPEHVRTTLSEQTMRRYARIAGIDLARMRPDALQVILQRWLARLIRIIMTTIAITESDRRKVILESDVGVALDFLERDDSEHVSRRPFLPLPSDTGMTVIEDSPCLTDTDPDDSDYDPILAAGSDSDDDYTSEPESVRRRAMII